MAWLMLQWKTVEPAGGVMGSRTSRSTVQLLVLWPVAQEAECRPKKKHLSGFWWPSIIDMEMNNYADALLLFFWKKQDAMFTHPYLILEGSHIHIREIHQK
uniref:Uncharacterized protein n=1 Tax=Triticum urartu TaxID=4572 RepID=A0A8R7PEK4_TRIUA